MIAKIARSDKLYAALRYNQQKVDQGKAEILLLNKIIETRDGKHTVPQLMRSFDPYLAANRKTKKYALHISLNPDPRFAVSDEQFCELAKQYMEGMGYGQQPYIVFKHRDIARTHIHIVSTCVDENGRKISDKFEKRRSMELCEVIKRRFGWDQQVADKAPRASLKVAKPVDYQTGNITSQISSVLGVLIPQYRFQTFKEFNTLLSLFNVTAELVDSHINGQVHARVQYVGLDEVGEKQGPPLKSSVFGDYASLDAIEKRIKESQISLSDYQAKDSLRRVLRGALHLKGNEASYRSALAQQGVDLVLRRNESGRIYGITFVDHRLKTVFNGSRLERDYSANIFNELWGNATGNEKLYSDRKKDADNKGNETLGKVSTRESADFNPKDPFRDSTADTAFGLFEALLSGSDYEDQQEQQFANNMKKRRKNKRRKL
ncbi:conjugal transfer protein MobB [Sphingobacterium bambusae]|uniref:Conjugal transfer protein MobB n=1 Tax=Sphingobacterium bambusae TaxID=662858 RepID=A0ABW6B8Q5_9SPHI|nr:conjugal transfer protein MobB [Sphingobacterium bambusae]WPL49165.1 conjugal transfer protein MobB [Sphingobacterium bambusae]